MSTYNVLVQKRLQLPDCSISQIWHGTTILAWALELPWRDNARRVSCIPTGRYELVAHESRKFGRCLLVKDVPGRSGILFHPANLTSQLKGCIAPATRVVVEEGLRLEYTGLGVREEVHRLVRAHDSKRANDAVHEVAFALLRSKPLYLDISLVNNFI
jgi:hypothetical protein